MKVQSYSAVLAHKVPIPGPIAANFENVRQVSSGSLDKISSYVQ